MRSFRAFKALLLFLLFLPGLAFSALVPPEGQFAVWYVQSCSYITANGAGYQCTIAGTSEFGTSQAALQAAADEYGGSYPVTGGTCDKGTLNFDPVIQNQPGTTDAQKLTFAYFWNVTSPCNSSTVTIWAYQRISATDPNPPAVDCSAKSGQKVSLHWEGSDPLSGAPSCYATPPGSPGCGVSMVGVSACAGGHCAGTGQYTGANCSSSAGENELPVVCSQVNGQMVCKDNRTQNCAWVNGERWCTDSVPDSGCLVSESGAALCDSGHAGPVDGNGQSIPPDTTIAAGEDSDGDGVGDTTNNYNYYSGGSMAGGSLSGNVSGNPDQGDGIPGSGDGNGEGEGEEGDPFSGPALDGEVPSFGGSLDLFRASVAAGPWGQVFAGDVFASGGGACPTATIPWLDGSSFTLDQHCELVESFGSALGIVFLFGWTFIAVRVVLSA